MEINYTIIIPHKNSPELLAHCLDTIPVRDDVQVIVVDDNSDAGKVNFDDFPRWGGAHYEYYLTKEGKGAGYARNVGLEHARGKWVLFSDSDDYFLPCISDVFDRERCTDADILFYRPKAVILGDSETPSKRAAHYERIVTEYLSHGDPYELRCRFYSPWSKIIKRELIEAHHIRFEEIPYSNDYMFSVMVGCAAAKIEARATSYYVVTEGRKSLTAGFCQKAGELQTRAGAYMRAQEVMARYGYKMDEENSRFYLNRLYVQDKEMFWACYRQLRTFGYSPIHIASIMYRYERRPIRALKSIRLMICSVFR